MDESSRLQHRVVDIMATSRQMAQKKVIPDQFSHSLAKEFVRSRLSPNQ